MWGGAEDEVRVGVAKICLGPFRVGKGALNAKVDVDSIIKGPIETGQTLGTLRIELDGKTLVSEPVVCPAVD